MRKSCARVVARCVRFEGGAKVGKGIFLDLLLLLLLSVIIRTRRKIGSLKLQNSIRQILLKKAAHWRVLALFPHQTSDDTVCQ